MGNEEKKWVVVDKDGKIREPNESQLYTKDNAESVAACLSDGHGIEEAVIVLRMNAGTHERVHDLESALGRLLELINEGCHLPPYDLPCPEADDPDWGFTRKGPCDTCGGYHGNEAYMGDDPDDSWEAEGLTYQEHHDRGIERMLAFDGATLVASTVLKGGAPLERLKRFVSMTPDQLKAWMDSWTPTPDRKSVV